MATDTEGKLATTKNLGNCGSPQIKHSVTVCGNQSMKLYEELSNFYRK